MKGNLHFSLFVLLFSLFHSTSKAQSDGVQPLDRDSSTVNKERINNSFIEKKVNRQFYYSSPKKDSLLGKSTEEKLLKNTTYKTGPISKSNPGEFSNLKIIRVSDADDDNKTDINAPLMPDFQVTAVKEEPYDNTKPSKEMASTQLVKLQRVAEDDFQAADASVNASQKHVTLSPLKRKYLEGIVTELEQEIKNGKKLSIETQARKKELEDLKKLLAE